MSLPYVVRVSPRKSGPLNYNEHATRAEAVAAVAKEWPKHILWAAARYPNDGDDEDLRGAHTLDVCDASQEYDRPTVGQIFFWPERMNCHLAGHVDTLLDMPGVHPGTQIAVGVRNDGVGDYPAYVRLSRTSPVRIVVAYGPLEGQDEPAAAPEVYDSLYEMLGQDGAPIRITRVSDRLKWLMEEYYHIRPVAVE